MITKRKKIIVPLFFLILILLSLIFVKLLLNRMNSYIAENGKSSMGAVVEQIQQTYDLQVNGYYSQLHLLEDSLIQEEVRSIELDRNKKFFEAWQKESESTLIFLQENGKAITTDGTKLRVDMPSKLLLDLRNGYNIGKLVSLDYNQKKKDGYLVAIPCQEYTINGETYTAIGTLYDHSKLDSMDFTTITGVNRWKFTYQSFCCHAASWKDISGKSIWDDETESKRNSCNLAWF